MKRILLPILAILLWFPALADEGMWLPGLIASRIDDMRAKGFHLSAEAIYSINQASMKDAVVLFDGGCTGELVSSEGLLLTNHHCGYDAIQRHSSLEHDYLTDGFWARTREEELPNENLNVRFLVRMEEITDRLAAGETAEAIIAEATADGRYKASIEQMYYGNQQFLFVYEQFDDVRLVGTPPSSIGKFGGDTDNWIWPRHTGDFSVFRIYADRENRPAPYSPDNVPYRPRRHFKISTRGVGEGDFTMIYGFPGNTQQYVLSDAVAYVEERSDPMKIDLRTRRLGIIAEAQEADPATRIRYAAKYANIANAWKKWQGEVLGLRRLGTIEKKRAYERDFARWAADKPEYAHLLDSMRAAYAAAERDYYVAELMYETGRTIDLCRLAALNLERSRAAAAGKSWSETAPEKESAYRAQYADFDPEVDRRLAECVLSGFAEYYPGGTLPADLRLKNIVREGEVMPQYYNEKLNACALDRCLLRAMDMIGWRDKPLAVDLGDRVRALGCALTMQGSGISNVDIAGIDTAMKLGANHPMGPLELGDFIGLDICLAIMDVLYKETGDSKYRACPLIRKMVRGGNLGCKSGKGFYVYNADRTKTPVDQL